MPALVILAVNLVLVGALLHVLAGVGLRRADTVQSPRRLDEWDTGVIRRVVIPAGAMVTNHRERHPRGK